MIYARFVLEKFSNVERTASWAESKQNEVRRHTNIKDLLVKSDGDRRVS